MSSQKNNTLDIDELIKGDYGDPGEIGNLKEDLEKILGEDTGFGKYGSPPKSFTSSIKFEPKKLSITRLDQETEDLLNESDNIYNNKGQDELDRNLILKKLMEEGFTDSNQIKIQQNEGLNMGNFTLI